MWGSRYEGGLQKLLQAEGAVADMRVELMALQPKLEEAGRQVAATMQVVNEQARAAEAQAEMVGLEETAASEAAAAAKSIKVCSCTPSHCLHLQPSRLCTECPPPTLYQ